jgi:transcriptional regulator with XRE-family HTH domain
MTVREQFAANLIHHRKAAELSQEQLAVLAGLHRTEVSMLERSVRLPRIDTVVKLAGALEVEPGEFFAGMSWRPEPPVYGRFDFPRD